MLHRDRAITKNDKRRQDRVQIKVLTCKLTNSIPSLQTALQAPDNFTDQNLTDSLQDNISTLDTTSCSNPGSKGEHVACKAKVYSLI